MSFSSEIKTQLCAVRELSEREMTAMLYGMFFAGKSVSGKPAVRTENLEIFTAAQGLCARVFKNEHYETRRLVKNGGSLYTLSVKSDIFGDFRDVMTIDNSVSTEAFGSRDSNGSKMHRAAASVRRLLSK